MQSRGQHIGRDGNVLIGFDFLVLNDFGFRFGSVVFNHDEFVDKLLNFHLDAVGNTLYQARRVDCANAAVLNGFGSLECNTSY
ncbi:MAG: hypothetical protein R3F37_13835 [Candidatus Competibacteraceae bacterium]